jgi:hypothetical protein
MRNEVAKKMTEWWVTMCCNSEYFLGAEEKTVSLTLCGRWTTQCLPYSNAALAQLKLEVRSR